MRNLPSSVAAHLAAWGGIDVHVLVWLVARDRETGEDEPFGFWTGADHQVIEVEGVERTYYGVGALLDHDPITSAMGMAERVWKLQVSPLQEQIVEAVRGYETRLAPIEVHEWHHSPLTHAPLADPIRVLRGTVMDLDIPTPPAGEMTAATISVTTDAWRLTRGLTLRRSHEALLARTGGADMFRQYNNIKGVTVPWGEKLAATASGSQGFLPTGLNPDLTLKWILK